MWYSCTPTVLSLERTTSSSDGRYEMDAILSISLRKLEGGNSVQSWHEALHWQREKSLQSCTVLHLYTTFSQNSLHSWVHP